MFQTTLLQLLFRFVLFCSVLNVLNVGMTISLSRRIGRKFMALVISIVLMYSTNVVKHVGKPICIGNSSIS